MNHASWLAWSLQVDPATVNEWLRLIFVIVGAMATIAMTLWKVFFKPAMKLTEDKVTAESRDRKAADIERDFRAEKHGREIHILMGKADLSETFQTRSEMTSGDLREKIGKIEGAIATLTATIHQDQLAHVRELADLRTEVRQGFAKLIARGGEGTRGGNHSDKER